jgi:L-aminopeptidase/D-esterase-like protein
VCYQFKGGIGTASRVALDGRFTVGVLVQTNIGLRPELMVLGVPVGQHFLNSHMPETGPGSIIIVLVTDAPLDSRQLGRLAMRAAFGLARTGTISNDGSGDFVVAFSTANRWAHEPAALVETTTRFTEDGRKLDELFLAVVESVEEAILNALVAAETMVGRDGNTLHAIPHKQLSELLANYHRRA